MLNNLLMMLSSGITVSGSFNVFVGKVSGSTQGTSVTNIGVHTVPNLYGEITPDQFLDHNILTLDTYYTSAAVGAQSSTFELDLTESEEPFYQNSTIRVTRRDISRSLMIPWYKKEGAIGKWMTTDNALFFTEADVGKTIPVSIIYTPPKLKHFSLILLKRLKAGCTRCAPVFLRLWRW